MHIVTNRGHPFVLSRAGRKEKTLEFLVCPAWSQHFPQLPGCSWDLMGGLGLFQTTVLRVVPLELNCCFQRIRKKEKKIQTVRQPRFLLQKLEQKNKLQDFDLSTPCFLRVSALCSKELTSCSFHATFSAFGNKIKFYSLIFLLLSFLS